MELKDRLEFCSKCKNRYFDPNKGLLCGLTKQKPDFEPTCPDFIEDEKVIEKLKFKESEETSQHTTIKKFFSETENEFAEERQHGGCLTTYLTVLLIFVVGQFFIILFSIISSTNSGNNNLGVPQNIFIIINLFILSILIVKFIGILLIFSWKKLGIYLFLVTVSINSIFALFANPRLAFIGIIIFIGIYMGIIHPKWKYFE